MDGIRVVRVWSYVTANQGFTLRILDYASYMISAILAAPFIRGVDVVIGTSPHLFTAIAAYAVSRIKRIPFVFELRDLWPASIKAVGAISEGRTLRMLQEVELFLYRKAACIVALTNAFRENLISRGIAPDKIKIVTNGADLQRFKPAHKDPDLVNRYGLKRRFVVGYIGTHGLAHSLDTVLEAAELLCINGDGDRYLFLFLGDGAMKSSLVSKAAKKDLRNVIFVDSVAKSEVVAHWALLDASVIHLRNDTLFETVVPSKLFESMAMGVPVLLGVRGEAANIVRSEQIGLTFEPESAEDLYKVLLELRHSEKRREQFHKNCLRAAKMYDRKALARSMLAILQSTVKNATDDTLATLRSR
jgi:glycosyltransferase involved in cell wall biosynthesis